MLEIGRKGGKGKIEREEEEQKEEEEEEEEEGKAVLRVDDVEKKSSREEAFIEESSVRKGVCVRVCATRGEECGGSK